MSKLQFLHGDVYEFLVANETMLGIVACYFLTIILTHGYSSLASTFRVLYIQDSGFESLYHTIQIVLNIYTVWGLSVICFLSDSSNIFGINALYNDRLEFFIFLHYASKILAVLDTVFLILSRKERQNFSFLHVYQYTSNIMLLGTFLQHGHGNGTVVNNMLQV
jgi:hypothetical protein